MRICDGKRVWRLDQGQFDRAIELLAEEFTQIQPIDSVVGIARGGCKTALQLSRRWNLPYYEVIARHNLSDRIHSAPMESVDVDVESIRRIPIQQSIVLVDDICGTGETLGAVKTKIRTNQEAPIVIKTITLCRNAGSTVAPNLCIWAVRDWVVFPWDPTPECSSTELLPEPQEVLRFE
jgi:hypoxanthine phosphoribosyltransferase